MCFLNMCENIKKYIFVKRREYVAKNKIEIGNNDQFFL